MPKYTVYFSQVVSISVDVDAADPESAIEAAYDEAPPGVCARCSGWGQEWFRDDDEELMVDEVADENGGNVHTESETWQRVPRVTATQDGRA
jgi:hypothetical protein